MFIDTIYVRTTFFYFLFFEKLHFFTLQKVRLKPNLFLMKINFRCPTFLQIENIQIIILFYFEISQKKILY